jgi:hypothetical protein
MNYIGISFIHGGRFGNQLFQYAFAKAYAEANQATLLTPKWIGQEIFNLSDPPLDISLPYTHFDEIPNGGTNIVLNGYFQFQDAINFMSRSKLKSWFQMQDHWKQKFTTHLPIAAHLRRGDYVKHNNVFCIVSENSYVVACEKFGLDINKITWMTEETQKTQEHIPFLEDFVLLQNANVLLRANSTFSWWAGVLGNGRIFSPLVEDRLGIQNVEFVEGNWPRIADTRNTHSNISDLIIKD